MDEILRIQLRNNLTDDCNSVMIVEGDGSYMKLEKERKRKKKERER